MAVIKKNTQTKKKNTTKKNTSNKKKSTKSKSLGKNVDYYEIKLLLLLSFTILSIVSLHSNFVGIIGRSIKNIYFGLFSNAGYFLPYIIVISVFYKLNNRLIYYRKKTIVGLVLLFISMIIIVNIFNTAYFEFNEINLLASGTSYSAGMNLEGSGLIGNIVGATLINLVGITGLYIIVATLWLVSVILITNIKISEIIINLFHSSKNSIVENAEIKKKAKEEYIKESERLESKHNKELEKLKIKKNKEEVVDKVNRIEEKELRARKKNEKKLLAEEIENDKKLRNYETYFKQSPTKSMVDLLFKKASIPTKEELKEKHNSKKNREAINKEEEEDFHKYESSGYSFDDNYTTDTIQSNSPDIFDNHLDSNISETELNEKITGFGTIIEESIKKAYEEVNLENTKIGKDEEVNLENIKYNEYSTDLPPVNDIKEDAKDEHLSSFDEAFKITESKNKAIHSSFATDVSSSFATDVSSSKTIVGDKIFENGDPMSPEEKQDAINFDNLINKSEKVAAKTVGTSTVGASIVGASTVEENKIPDSQIVNHMSESVKLEFENYKIPSINVLKKNKTLTKETKGESLKKARLLEEILKNFNVEAKVIQISKGPAITRYEMQLKPGTKMSKIVGLSDDIALNLATQQVRIAAVPGKPAVGIEIANDSTSLVCLREVLETDAFRKVDSKLGAGLGKNISGSPIIADLAKMPHLLIAGATGSGKSVCVNTLITSILLKAKPDEVKFLMIDPKVVELNNYNGIPHLILPVVTDPKKASVALNWAVQEMTRRYNEFAKSGVRDVKGYNKKNGDNKELFMPQIVIVIDELADLMMVAPNQVEDAICRLAQMARAAGLHLIVATQRPSVDVITGVIKANIPSRIAFAVSSAIDSRTIIDMGGAEKLLGKGDMLYYPAGSAKPERVQGAFISDEEVEAVVNAVKNQFEEFSYDSSILDNVSNTIAKENTSEDDEHLVSAINLVVGMEQASISMLQRKFKIGYNRAARLIDEMESRGIVGPSLGSKPRLVLVSQSELENM